MSLDREFIAQVIITLAVCVGGWMMIVEPKAGELADLEHAMAEVQSSPMPGQNSLAMLSTRVQSFRERVRGIESQNAFARDSSQMYGRIMNLAAKHQVSVQRLDPGSVSATNAAGPIHSTTFDMTVEGVYEQLAEFLDAIAEMEGFVRPRSLSLQPREQKGQLIVEARFVCDAVSFELPPALMAMSKGEDVDVVK